VVMRNANRFRWVLPVLLLGGVGLARAEPAAPHHLWIEAEQMAPLKGSNFSFQQEAQQTKGSWSLSGPGVAAEWTQGGESEFMSIAARADEPAGTTVSHKIGAPADGNYTMWARYADYRNKSERYGSRLLQAAGKSEHILGEKA